MATNKPVALRELLGNPTSSLAELKRSAERMESLAHSVRSALPNAVKPHLVSANVRDDRLILVADSAVWAARMRFYVSDVTQVMAAIHTSDISRVDIRVRPDWRDLPDTSHQG